METVIILILLAALLAVWCITEKRRLTQMNENTRNAMNQIGVQISSRFDALTVLLELAKGYAANEACALYFNVEAGRRAITAQSVPEDVEEQEELIRQTVECLSNVAKGYPALIAAGRYAACVAAVECYEKMVRTGSLIYNDSVKKLNGALGKPPVRLIAGVMGIHRKEYLETEQGGNSYGFIQ